MRNIPRLIVNHLEEIKRIESEVHRAARRVQHADFARVFQGARLNKHWLTEQRFLRKICTLRAFDPFLDRPENELDLLVQPIKCAFTKPVLPAKEKQKVKQ